MNKVLFFSFALLLLLPIGNSFGANFIESEYGIFIFVQTTVRNSDGTLISYLESSKFTNLNISALNSFLDFEASQGNDPIIIIDGQNFQVIQRVQTPTSHFALHASVVLSDNVNGNPIQLARFAHDGIPVLESDTVESMWTFVRPVA